MYEYEIICENSVSPFNCPFSMGLPVTPCCGGAAHVVLDPSVTSIANNAFSTDSRPGNGYDDGSVSDLCTNIVSFTASGVTSVGDRAFSGLSQLNSFSAPGLVTIGARAFETTGLITFDFTHVTSIGAHAFSRCTLLMGAINAPLVTSIGKDAFVDCSGLTSFNAPLVTSIGNYAFYYCESLSSFTASPMLISSNIKLSAFIGCHLKCAQISPARLANNGIPCQ